jgi:O-antigen/teichoic acid export membrane protein
LLASVFAGLRYDSAAVLPRDDRVALVLLWAVCVLGGAVALVICVGALAGAIVSRDGPMSGRFFWFGLALAVWVVLNTLQRAATTWCTRKRKFGGLGATQIALSAGTVAAQILFAQHFGGEAGSLIAGHVLGTMVATALLCWLVWHEMPAKLCVVPQRRALQVILRRYRRFPLFMVGYALASVLRDRMLQLALGGFAGAATVGKYAMATRVTGAPNSLAYSAISPVFYSFASRAVREDVAREAAGLIEITLALATIPFVVLAVDSRDVVAVLLGHAWDDASPYFSALAWPMLALTATCWLDRLFDVYGRQRTAVALEVAQTLCCLAIVSIVAPWLGGLAAVRLLAGWALAYYLVYAVFAFRAGSLDVRVLTRPLLVFAGMALVAGAAVLFGYRLDSAYSGLALYAFVYVAAVGGWIGWAGGRRTAASLGGGRLSGGTGPNEEC